MIWLMLLLKSVLIIWWAQTVIISYLVAEMYLVDYLSEQLVYEGGYDG